MPPSFATLEQRLRGRSKDSEPQIQRRLQVARDEVAAYSEYDFVVVNDDVTAAVERLHGIVLAERARLPRMQGEAARIGRTFSLSIAASSRIRSSSSSPPAPAPANSSTDRRRASTSPITRRRRSRRRKSSPGRSRRSRPTPSPRKSSRMSLVALGVTGGIGAYKAVEVARGLQKRGHEVVAVMTHSAAKFVGPITFEAIARRHVITDQFEAGMNADIEHIAIASTIDLLLIAPATANIIGKMAN